LFWKQINENFFVCLSKIHLIVILCGFYKEIGPFWNCSSTVTLCYERVTSSNNFYFHKSLNVIPNVRITKFFFLLSGQILRFWLNVSNKRLQLKWVEKVITYILVLLQMKLFIHWWYDFSQIIYFYKKWFTHPCFDAFERKIIYFFQLQHKKCENENSPRPIKFHFLSLLENYFSSVRLDILGGCTKCWIQVTWKKTFLIYSFKV